MEDLADSTSCQVDDARHQLYAIKELSNLLRLELEDLDKHVEYPMAATMCQRAESMWYLLRLLVDAWECIDANVGKMKALARGQAVK